MRQARDVLRRRARSHESNPPDFSGKRTKPGTYLNVVTLQETCPDSGVVYTGRNAYGVETPEALVYPRKE
jgi:hypothetical protein